MEYGRLWERMQPVLAPDGGGVRSAFYWPHHLHDAKVHPLSTVSLVSTSHSDRQAIRLREILAHSNSPGAFEDSEEGALELS